MEMVKSPLRLLPNRVWRTYTGGMLIEKWGKNPCAADSNMPEDWIFSVVRARNPDNVSKKDEGLSYAEDALGNRMSLQEFFLQDPAFYLGQKHVSRFGTDPGILIKLLDSAERLTIQVHPDLDAALKLFNSEYGKTEAWYIIDGRYENDDPPYILLGFKPGVTKELWRRLFETQDIAGMIASLNKVYVEPGQIYLVEGGMPHAIGPGCFILEIQEPTDFTVRVEKITPNGLQIPDALCHQGIGFEKMFDCFNYNKEIRPFGKEGNLKPVEVHEFKYTIKRQLIGQKDTNLFQMDELKVLECHSINNMGSFCVITVLGGCGRITWQGGELM